MHENGYDSIEDLPEIIQPGQVLLLGLIIMADWITSNENYFPLYNLETYSEKNQSLRMRTGWEKWFKTIPLSIHPCFDINYMYKKRFGFLPRDIQTVFSDTIEKTDNPGLFILEAPMGEGKTEAALIGAEQLAERNSKSGLFMGLPTQATANGIFTRIKSWLCKISNEYDENISLQLKHSKSNLNEEYTSLATNINIDEVNDEKQHRRSDDEITLNQWLSDNNSVSDIISNKWFSGRKTSMLDDVVVGTVDNFLLAALKQKHLPLRHLGLSKKVVIIDEVHAYDAYMSEYLEQAIKWMGAYDVPVILLSATLPSKSRERFAKAYLRGKGLKNKEIVNNDEILLTTAYPLITYTDGNAICIVDKFEKIKNKAITVKKLNRNCLYDKVEELFSNDGIIGIIVNTVRDAQNIAKECAEIFGEDQIFLLHSGFIATERVKKEKELIEIIGKDASRPNKKIIIGTQVIEQSLDIDFDVMISDLAPMDLLIQRMGRLHRHNISRPKNYNNPVIYVMGTSDEFDFNKGSKYVYGGYLLAKTQEFLPDIINLPKDISKLVQGVYANEKNELELNSDERIKEMKNEFENERKKKRSRAKTYLLSNPEYERFNYEDEIVSMIGWLKDVNPNSAEEYGYAQVRDTQETIEVIALKRQGTGYGFFNSEEDVSDMLDDYNVLKKIAASTIKLPLLFSMYGNVDKTIDEIEKYNEKYLSDWQQKPLLKGSLGLIFDDKGDINLCGKRLHYSEKYGLSIIRKDDNDE